MPASRFKDLLTIFIFLQFDGSKMNFSAQTKMTKRGIKEATEVAMVGRRTRWLFVQQG